jgi:hypothetical protein
VPHVVLLGDSILDNGAYVRGGPDVVRQLRRLLPHEWKATLCAVDGATIADVPDQFRRIPAEATHLVLSVGGNDALGHVDILERRASSWPEVLDGLADMAARFERRYRDLLAQVIARDLPLVLCTIYLPRFPDPDLQRRASTALAVFNDAILRAAFERGLPVIDLRLVCTDDADYANPIEPSERGGEKIARAIKRATVGREPVSRRASEIVIA